MSKGSLSGPTTSCSTVNTSTCCVLSICLCGVGIKVAKVKVAL